MRQDSIKKTDLREEAGNKQLIDKLFPERAERERIKTLEKADSAGAVKAHILMTQLFSHSPRS